MESWPGGIIIRSDYGWYIVQARQNGYSRIIWYSQNNGDQLKGNVFVHSL